MHKYAGLAIFIVAGVGLFQSSASRSQDQYRGLQAQRCAVDNCSAGTSAPQGPNPVWMAIGSLLGVRHSSKPTGADPAAQQAYNFDEQGVEAEKAGNLSLAASYYNRALAFTPNDAIIRRNLAIAYDNLGMIAFNGHDYAKALSLFQQAIPYIPSGDPGQATVANNIALAQSNLDAARADRDANARIRNVIQGYAKDQPAVGTNGGGGLGFGDFDGGGHNATPALGFNSFGDDSSVVDARNAPSGLPKEVDEAIPRTPAGNRERKGYQAIQTHDWKAALAWFQDALNQDPGNPGIQRLIDLAKFTMAHEDQVYRPALDVPAPKPDDPQWHAFLHDYVPAHPEVVAETRAAAAPVLDDPDLRPLSQAGHAGPLTDAEVGRRVGELRQAALQLARKSAENEDLGLLFAGGPPGTPMSDIAQSQADLAREFLANADAMQRCKCQTYIILPVSKDIELLGGPLGQ